MKLLITGGAGFIGSNFVRYLLSEHPSVEVRVLDKLTYAGNVKNLQDVLPDIELIKGDISEKQIVDRSMHDCESVINFAAETHVDRSIANAQAFIQTDIVGTHVLLEAVKEHQVKQFIQISTDEVYGSINEGSFKEADPLHPSSPYAASKAGADLLVLAYVKTYGLPCTITRSSNNYGPYQHPEKLIPHFITNAIRNHPLTIYGRGDNVRDWIHVRDNCRAIDLIRRKGEVGEVYNIGAGNERSNLEVTKIILRVLEKPTTLMRFIADRPGHDYRYSVNCSKIKALGWSPVTAFDEGLEQTIHWYKNNESWWAPLINQ